VSHKFNNDLRLCFHLGVVTSTAQQKGTENEKATSKAGYIYTEY